MTSATFSRATARRWVRSAAAAASLAGVLALTACSGDGGSDEDTSAGPSTSASASADTGGTSGGSEGATAPSDGLEGSWLATTDGDAVVLVVTGAEAGLFATGGVVCSGTAGKESGAETIRLTCSDGSKDRAEGTVDSVGKSTLEVTWKSGLGKETYTRSEGGQLPSGLPTASLGS
ncbi:hypothetical protein [Streptomyces sp. AC555_RSS877]|uniref:hypothetical protein n=1 Tax=Streptomyces sp. AC555_RSS877 TaxID=2823688 RepID=UPI001C26C551|nr:hypothetical protein [Streptomyces sp. AC555_RSS877]